MTTTGTNQNHVQDYNRRIVLNSIRVAGPLSRADLGRRTRLSSPAVSGIVASLLEEDLIREAGPRPVARGRAPMDYQINPEGGYSIGLNLDRDSLVGVLVDLAGEEKARVQADLDSLEPDVVLPLMRRFIRDLRASMPVDRLWGIGIGFPGPIEANARTVDPVGVEGWKDVRIEPRLLSDGEAPVFVENNATAAAIGERWYGVGQRLRTFYYVLFGVGIGGGLITDGRPYRGATGNVARLGRTVVPDAEGRFRPLESYVSLTTMYDRLRAGGRAVATPDDLAELHRSDRSKLAPVLEELAEHLALPIYNVDMQFDPEAIVFGGRLPHSVLDELVQRIERRLERLQPSPNLRFARLVIAEAGEDTAALGAATLPVYHALAPSHDLVFVQREGRNPYRRNA